MAGLYKDQARVLGELVAAQTALRLATEATDRSQGELRQVRRGRAALGPRAMGSVGSGCWSRVLGWSQVVLMLERRLRWLLLFDALAGLWCDACGYLLGRAQACLVVASSGLQRLVRPPSVPSSPFISTSNVCLRVCHRGAGPDLAPWITACQ